MGARKETDFEGDTRKGVRKETDKRLKGEIDE